MTPPRLPTATKADRLSDAMLRELAPNDNIVGWMATELLALRAAGDALAEFVERAEPWVTLHCQSGFPAVPSREVTARQWNALEGLARAWRTARGEG